MPTKLQQFDDDKKSGKYDHPAAKKIIDLAQKADGGRTYHQIPTLARYPKPIREAIPAPLRAEVRNLWGGYQELSKFHLDNSYQASQLEWRRRSDAFAKDPDANTAPGDREDLCREFRLRRQGREDEFVKKYGRRSMELNIALFDALAPAIESFIEERLKQDAIDSEDVGTALPASPLVFSLASQLAGIHLHRERLKAKLADYVAGHAPFIGFEFDLARQLGLTN